MKILIVNHFPLVGSGSGVYIKNIAKSMKKRGHDVCIIMPENTTNITYLDNIKIHPVFFKNQEIIEGQADFNFPCMDSHPRSNFLFHTMTDSQIQEYVDLFKKAIKQEIDEFKPDVIHAQHIWIVSGLLSEYKIPYIITSHGAEFITYKKTDRFDNYGNSAVDGCKKIIAISDDNINEIIEKFPNAKDKIIYVKNGYNPQEFYKIDLNKEDALKKFGINKKYNKIVLFVGRISKMKGLDTLINAAKIYEKDDVLTLIVGDGDYKAEANLLKEKLGLNNIVFLGNKGPENLNILYNIADVLVLPSRKEALPLVAIEALACGTPAIVTNQSGMEKIIIKDVGLTFKIDDEKMLAEQIQKVINKEIIFDINKIIDYARSNFSQDILMDKLEKIYKEVKG